MKYKILSSGDQFEIVFLDGGEIVRALPMCPVAIEAELLLGRWLVLAFAVWSGPDRSAIDALLKVLDELPQGLKVGVRPFDSHKEFLMWCPKRIPSLASPIWILINDGEVVDHRVGLMSPLDIVEFSNAWNKHP